MHGERPEGTIATLAPTVARLFAAPLPALAREAPLDAVLALHRRAAGGRPIERRGHVDPATGRGDHGLDIPEDMQVFHWYGLLPAPS